MINERFFQLFSELNATVFAVLDDHGMLLEASRGFRKLLPESQMNRASLNASPFFLQPKFEELKNQPLALYKGLFTLGTFSGQTNTVFGFFCRENDAWLFFAEHPVEQHATQFSKLIIELSESHRKLAEANTKLKRLERLAVERSHTDPLTGLSNRRSLTAKLNAEMSRAKRYHRKLHLIMCDLDDFKKINDECGHDIGDIVLTDFARLILGNTRKGDFVYRLGGEEFLIIVPEEEIDGAVLLAERIRSALENMTFSEHSVKNTASFGVASFSIGDTPESFLKRADEAMYTAKNAGKNKVMRAVTPAA